MLIAAIGEGGGEVSDYENYITCFFLLQLIIVVIVV